jgi:hypothetical protein
MSRFQALTSNVVDQELEALRRRLGLEPSQKAELLREVSALAAWVVRQAEQGRSIEARSGAEVEALVHPALERLRAERQRSVAEAIGLSDAEVTRLADVLDRGFDPPPALRRALSNLAKANRTPPKLRWKKTAA